MEKEIEKTIGTLTLLEFKIQNQLETRLGLKEDSKIEEVIGVYEIIEDYMFRNQIRTKIRRLKRITNDSNAIILRRIINTKENLGKTPITILEELTSIYLKEKPKTLEKVKE